MSLPKNGISQLLAIFHGECNDKPLDLEVPYRQTKPCVFRQSKEHFQRDIFLFFFEVSHSNASSVEFTRRLRHAQLMSEQNPSPCSLKVSIFTEDLVKKSYANMFLCETWYPSMYLLRQSREMTTSATMAISSQSN